MRDRDIIAVLPWQMGPPMLIKSLSACPSLLAKDGCRIFELLHMKNDAIELPYSLAVAEIEPGDRSYRHRLRQTEVYYVITGHGRMHVDDEMAEIEGGDAVLIPGGAEQWIENVADHVLRFIAVVSPPWSEADDERLE
jgi:mannose-6-phosphate isomerase-like protein (cupin superfamily)